MNKQSNPKLSTMLAVATGAGLAALVVVAALYSTGIVSVPVFGGSFDRTTPGVRASGPTNSITVTTAENRAPLNAYASGVRNDLFKATGVPQSVGSVNPSPSASPSNAPVVETPHTSAPAANDNTWMYTGTVAVGSRRYAVLENAQTHNGRFLQAGDKFGEGKVKSFSSDSVMLLVHGRTEHLYKNRNYSLVPLNSNAPYLKVAAVTAQSAAAAAAKPGQTSQTNANTPTATPAQTAMNGGQAQVAPISPNGVQLEGGFVPAVTNSDNTSDAVYQKKPPAVEPVAPPQIIEAPAAYTPGRAYEPMPRVVYPNVEFVNVRPGFMGMGRGR